MVEELVAETVKIARSWLERRPTFGSKPVEAVVAEGGGSFARFLSALVAPSVKVVEGVVEGVPEPAIEVKGEEGGSTVFVGYPLLYEVEALLDSILERSYEYGEAERAVEALAERGVPVDLDAAEREAYLLVAPECPFCPKVAFALACAAKLVPSSRYYIIDGYSEELIRFFEERSGVEATAVPLLAAGSSAYVGAPRGGAAQAVAYVLAVLGAVAADPVSAAELVGGKG